MSKPNEQLGKRKRELEAPQPQKKRRTLNIQVVVGSYERILHGVTVQIENESTEEEQNEENTVTFANNFLFAAHASSIRCLALSPPSDPTRTHTKRRILATGSSDERINIYQISTAPARRKSSTLITDSGSNNRELGSLLHHSSAITSLYFPSHSKLLSASLDNTIAVTRMRDMTVLSSIKAPIPNAVGRPSGDTAAAGEVPAGVIDVAVHPSARLCLSVGLGEKCMRLWNLVTGKKAGVLAFDKELLSMVGINRWRGGEARQVVWSQDGSEFAVAFERGVAVYSLDCTVRGVAQVLGTKVCQVRFISSASEKAGAEQSQVDSSSLLAVSTEDGRVIFFDTKDNVEDLPVDTTGSENTEAKKSSVSLFHAIAQIGTPIRGSRIKDFEILQLPSGRDAASTGFIIVTGSSSGTLQIWKILASDVRKNLPVNGNEKAKKKNKTDTNGHDENQILPAIRHVGANLATYETGKRITCLTAFIMDNLEPVANGITTNGTTNEFEDHVYSEDGFEGFEDEQNEQGLVQPDGNNSTDSS